jgi:hypothetical protein
MRMADPLTKVMIEPSAAQDYFLRLNRFDRIERDGEVSGILKRGSGRPWGIFRHSVMSRPLTLGHRIPIRA